MYSHLLYKHTNNISPRNIPLALRLKVQLELERMEGLEVMSRVNEPTPWCAAMVIVPKPSVAVCMCINMKPLMKMSCERHIQCQKSILPWHSLLVQLSSANSIQQWALGFGRSHWPRNPDYLQPLLHHMAGSALINCHLEYQMCQKFFSTM